MGHVLAGFEQALDDIELKHITAAFKEWLKTSDKFPTPANIRKIAADTQRVANARAAYSDTQHVRAQPAGPVTRDVVPWAFKVYSQCVDAGLVNQIIHHVNNVLPEARRRDYVLYLQRQCGFPPGFLGYIKGLGA
jgi:hypothetical protein